MEGAEKYHRQIDPEGQSSVAQVLRWVRPGSKVLEMGPATGIMTRFLSTDKGCHVTCVEVDASAAEQARPYCARMIVGDLNREEWAREIEHEQFDYVIFADVLEHLLHPATSLQHTLKYLKPDGEVLISVPNIGYVGVIAELLEGRFDYRRDGLLDETHVHFFTRKSLVQLLGQTGLVSLEWGRTTLAPEFSEFRLQTNQLGTATRGVLSSVPDGDTYQFLVRCSRTGVAALPVIPQGREYAHSGLSAQVYFDSGNGFSEQDSIVFPLIVSSKGQTLQVPCPAGVKVVRLDPIDSVMPVAIRSISVQSGETTFYRWNSAQGALSRVSGLHNVVEAHTSNLSVLMPLSNDPAVTILVDCPEQATLTVELSFDGPDTLAELVQKIGQFNDEKIALENRVNLVSSELERAGYKIADLSKEVLDKDESLRQYEAEVIRLRETNRLTQEALNGIVQSKSWRLTRPLRVGVRLIRALRRLSKRMIKQTAKQAVMGSKRLAESNLAGYLWQRLALGSEYELRMLRLEPAAQGLARMREESLVSKGPVFSVVMPTYKTDPKWLKAAIESVRQQAYPFWELCIADDASDDPGVRSVLSTYTANDPRIKVIFLADNGHISKSSNAALELATGEFIVLLDHDDCFAPHALYRLAQAIKENPSTDVIYSDEDKVSLDGTRWQPTCKPAWSPDYFLSFMYTGHISCFRTSLVRAVGGFRVGFEGSQDYDLMLRVTERTDHVVHIPEVLYHWRVHEQSVAGNLDCKPYAFTAAKRALTEALHRRGFSSSTVSDSRARGLYLVHRNEKASVMTTAVVGPEGHALNIPDGPVDRYNLGDISKLVQDLRSRIAEETEVIALVCEASVPAGTIDRLLDHCSDQGIGVAAPLVMDDARKVVAAGIAFHAGFAKSNFQGLCVEQLGYRGRLAIPFNVSSVLPACVVFRARLLDEIPSSVASIAELVTAICFAARKRDLRCMVDPSVRVVLNHTKPDFELSSLQLEALITHFDLTGKPDPFLPAGLSRYEDCVEMPAV